MHISVKGRQLDIGDALRAHAERTTENLVGKFFDKAIDAQVIFAKEAHTFRADISVHPLRGVTVQGSGSGGDAYAAFEAAAARVERQLRRYKGRLSAHKGKGEAISAQYAIIASEPGGGESADADARADARAEAESSSEEGQPVIIAEMAADVPVCSVSGAVMRLDLANVPAVLFRNSAHGGLNMVYRRPDGNIGWVDPQGAPPPARGG